MSATSPPSPNLIPNHERQMPNPRYDIVDVYLVREHVHSPRCEFLQMRRAESPLRATWQPLMGHIEPGETAVTAAIREMQEEVGLSTADGALRELLALEQVHPFFLAELDAIVFSPRFVALVDTTWEPTLNDEHDAHRWVAPESISAAFMWPGQRAACAEILEILTPPSLAREHLRVSLA
jgi:8-oxo-dGTP pyrophosphatase MutT (NUDIX family)